MVPSLSFFVPAKAIRALNNKRMDKIFFIIIDFTFLFFHSPYNSCTSLEHFLFRYIDHMFLW